MSLLLIGSAFFSGSETALFSIPGHRLKELSTKSPAQRAILLLMKRPSRLLVGILLGNLLVNVLFFSLSATLALSFKTTLSQTIFGFVILAAVILCGEILPKAAGVSKPLKLAMFSAPILLLFLKLTAPLLHILEKVTRLMEPKGPPEVKITEDELKMLLNLSAGQHSTHSTTGEILEDVIELSSRKLRELMIPRPLLYSCHPATTVSEVIAKAAPAEVDFIPVCEDNIDNFLGIVETRQLFLEASSERLVGDYIKAVRFVPESKYAGALLDEMIAKDERLAIAVDEYGGISGLVTRHLLLEAAAGRLATESNLRTEPEIREIRPGRYLVSGHLAVTQWQDFFTTPLTITTAEPFKASTLSGFVIALMGELPEVGQSVQFQNLKFTIHSMQHRHVRNILVEVIR